MNAIINVIVSVLLVGMTVVLCLFLWLITPFVKAYWEYLKKDMENRDERG